MTGSGFAARTGPLAGAVQTLGLELDARMKIYARNLFRFLLILLWLPLSCGGDGTDGKSDAETTPPAAADSRGRGVPVEALIVTRQSIEQNVPLIGVLQPRHSVDLVAEVSGKIQKIFKKLGDRVTPADTLALIDDRIPLSQYRQANAAVLSAETNLKIARLNLRSDEELFKNGDISELAYENSQLAVKTAEASYLSARANLHLAEKNYRDTRVTPPFAGLVSREYVDLGTMVTPNSPLFRIVDLQTLKIEVGVPQVYISRVRTGNRVDVRISSLGDEIFKGAVKFVSPQADEASGAFTAEIHLANTRDFALRAGMTAKIDLQISEHKKQFAVPDYALVAKDGGDYVYKISGNMAKLTKIDAGESLGSHVIVQSGLADGDTIVVVGMKNLGVETRVRIESLHGAK